MSRTPQFSGTGEGEREAAARIAERLMGAHRDLGYEVLWSAAAFLIRDGQSPTDSRVLEEARRRKAQQVAAAERGLKRVGRTAS